MSRAEWPQVVTSCIFVVRGDYDLVAHVAAKVSRDEGRHLIITDLSSDIPLTGASEEERATDAIADAWRDSWP